jgi:DNA-binding GntR family transcriptional regulator
LEVLRQEGLIETRHGTGSVVKERAQLARTAGERYRTSLATGYIYTAGEYAEILAAEKVPAPKDVAAALDVEVGDDVVRRQRVTFEGENPTSISVSWFTAEVAEAAPRLLQRERIREGTTRYVELQTGRRPHTGRDWWTARLATDDELSILRLDNPQAVSEARHVSYCSQGQPLTYEIAVSPAGRWRRTEEYSMQT